MRHRSIFAAILAASTLCTAPALAASFDCTKASKPSEKLICATPDLSKADIALAREYTRLQDALPASLKPVLQKGQRSWIIYATLNCSSDGRGTISKTTDFSQCLLQEYERRLAALSQQPRQIGPFRVMQADEFQAMPSSSKDPDFFPIVSHVKSVARVYGDNEAQAARVNQWLGGLAANANASWNDPDTSASFSLTLTAANDVFASASVETDVFAVGAAHPLALTKMVHLVMATGKALTWRDMFQPQARAKLTSLAWTALKKKLGPDLMIEKQSELAKLVEDPGHWYFTAQGLRLQFNVYEVAAYVMGPQEITLPWPMLKGSLSTLGETIADAARE